MKTIIVLAVLAISQFGVVHTTDYQCMSDCSAKGYAYRLCKQMCSY